MDPKKAPCISTVLFNFDQLVDSLRPTITLQTLFNFNPAALARLLGSCCFDFDLTNKRCHSSLGW